MNKAAGCFVTGTDTGIGKTVVSLGLMQALQDRGLTVAGMKPVASGCEPAAGGLRNDDALRLQQQSSIPLAYEEVNPYAFAPAIAPHLAAAAAGVRIDLDVIAAAYHALATRVDYVVVEGVGGWLVPLNDREHVSDLARTLSLDVCLVVGMRLGCINHALLTAGAIEGSGCSLAGWVANRLPPPMENVNENINSLKSQLSVPLIGSVPALGDIRASIVAQCLDISW